MVLEVLINIVLHICFLVTILGLAFMFYVSKVIKSGVQYELQTNVQSTINNLLPKLNLSSTVKAVLRKILENYPFNTPASAIANTLNNGWLFICVSIIIFIWWSVLALLLIFISLFKIKHDFKIFQLLLENLLIFVGIGAVEITFFTQIASKYAPVSPNYLNDLITSQLKSVLSASQ